MSKLYYSVGDVDRQLEAWLAGPRRDARKGSFNCVLEGFDVKVVFSSVPRADPPSIAGRINVCALDQRTSDLFCAYLIQSIPSFSNRSRWVLQEAQEAYRFGIRHEILFFPNEAEMKRQLAVEASLSASESERAYSLASFFRLLFSSFEATSETKNL